MALEDSAHGVAAAKAAGMVAVAVPSRITRYNDFASADLVVASVADLTVPGSRPSSTGPRSQPPVA